MGRTGGAKRGARLAGRPVASRLGQTICPGHPRLVCVAQAFTPGRAVGSVISPIPAPLGATADGPPLKGLLEVERMGIEKAASPPGVNAWATQNVGMTGWEFRALVFPSFRPERSREPEPMRGWDDGWDWGRWQCVSAWIPACAGMTGRAGRSLAVLEPHLVVAPALVVLQLQEAPGLGVFEQVGEGPVAVVALVEVGVHPAEGLLDHRAPKGVVVGLQGVHDF